MTCNYLTSKHRIQAKIELLTLRNGQTCVGPASPSGRPTGEVIVVVVGVGETVEHYVHLGAHVLQAAGFSRVELARHCLVGMNEKRRERVKRAVVVITTQVLPLSSIATSTTVHHYRHKPCINTPHATPLLTSHNNHHLHTPSHYHYTHTIVPRSEVNARLWLHVGARVSRPPTCYL